MWVIKTHGETFYVAHVTCELPWSTKETPDNTHTKGSIKVRDCLLTIDDNNEAHLVALTVWDRVRLRNQKLGITRIIFEYGSQIHNALKRNEFRHSPFKNVTGGCGTSFVVCDLLDRSEATFAALKYRFRVLKPNEGYYRAYDGSGDTIEEDSVDE
jgi:hypothetical protein